MREVLKTVEEDNFKINFVKQNDGKTEEERERGWINLHKVIAEVLIDEAREAVK